MVEAAETPVEKETRLTSSWRKKNRWRKSSCPPPSEVSELVADVIPASVNPLEQEFDNDAGEEFDLRRDKDEMEVITCEVGPSLLADVQAISRKGKIIRSTIIFNRFKFFLMTITVIYHQMKLHWQMQTQKTRSQPGEGSRGSGTPPPPFSRQGSN